MQAMIDMSASVFAPPHCTAIGTGRLGLTYRARGCCIARSVLCYCALSRFADDVLREVYEPGSEFCNRRRACHVRRRGRGGLAQLSFRWSWVKPELG